MNKRLKHLKIVRKIANQGNAKAQFYLGDAYYYGRGLTQDYVQSVKWYQQAANQGHAEAQYHLALAYHEGEGIEQNYAKAMEWYQKAAVQKHADAQYQLGLAYYEGEYVEQDYAKATEWLHGAANQGHIDAQYDLGIAYYEAKAIENGKFVQDYAHSVNLWRKAGFHGHDDAQFHLGLIYYEGKDGQGVVQNFKKATFWWLKAANNGHVEAQYYLGNAYYKGKDFAKNEKEAFECWLKAANQGHIKAKYKLGVAYREGLGTPKNDDNDKKALELLLQFVRHQEDDKNLKIPVQYQEDNNSLRISAQCLLGIMYKKGEGCSPNYEEAKKWLNKAYKGTDSHKNYSESEIDFLEVQDELIQIVRLLAHETLVDIAKLEEQEKAKQKLEQTNQALTRSNQLEQTNQALTRSNQQVEAEKRRVEGLVREYRHTLANEIHPWDILNVANLLKKQGFTKEALSLNKAYHGEVFIWHQNELSLTKYQEPTKFRQNVLENRAEANNDSDTNISVYRILNDALEKITANFLNKSKYPVLKEIRQRILGENLERLSELYESFVNQVSLEEQEPLEWVNKNLMPIRLSAFSEKWANVRVQKYKCTEALLHKHFYELLLNVYKYSDFKELELHFFEQDGYLVSHWTNTYRNNKSISTQNGLDSIKDDLQMLNEGQSGLLIHDDSEQRRFSITLKIQEQLLYLPPVLFEVQLPV